MDPIERERRFNDVINSMVRKKSFRVSVKEMFVHPFTNVSLPFWFVWSAGIILSIVNIFSKELVAFIFPLFLASVLLGIYELLARLKSIRTKNYREFGVAEVSLENELLSFAIFRKGLKDQEIYKYQEIVALKEQVERKLENRQKSSRIRNDRLFLLLLTAIIALSLDQVPNLGGEYNISAAWVIIFFLVLVVLLVLLYNFDLSTGQKLNAEAKVFMLER